MPDRTGRLSAGECLDPEVLSAYVDGKLDVRERAEVEAHLASCADCYEVMSEALHIHEAIPAARPGLSSTPSASGRPDAAPDVSSAPPAWSSARQPRRDAQVPRPSGDIVVRGAFGRRKAVWGVAGGLLAAAAALVLVVRLQPTWWTGGVDPKLADLVEAVGEERTVEARLTGGFKYGPLRSPMRSGGRVGPTDNWSLLAAAGRIRELAEKDPTSENLHALGVAQVLLGQHDEGIATLERATEGAPERSQFVSDLAAAYVARAANQGQMEDYATALETAERATRLEPPLTEAWFNRALALEAMGLAGAANAAWQDYLQRDATSAWAEEARRRAQSLQAPKPGAWEIERERLPTADDETVFVIAKSNPQVVREWLEEVVLGDWATATLSHEDRSAQSLQERASRIAAMLQQVQEDDLPSVGIARLAVPASDRERLARGHASLNAGRTLYLASRMADAQKEFANAAELLEGLSPYSNWAQFHLAVLPYFRGDFLAARTALIRLQGTIEHLRFPNLRGRIHWMLGLIAVGEGRFAEATRDYVAAAAIFEACHEPEGLAHAHNLLAELDRDLGDSDWWNHLTEANRLNFLLRPQRRHAILINGAQGALQMEKPLAALSYQRATITNALTSAPSNLIAEAYQWLFAVQMKLGELEAATDTYEQAKAWAAKAVDPGLSSRRAAELASIEAELLATSNPQVALQSAAAAEQFFAGEGRRRRLPAIHLSEARAREAAGDLAGALKAIEAGLSVVEEQRRGLASSRLRASYYEERWALIEFAVRLQSGAGDPRATIELIERLTGRTLTETLQATAANLVMLRRDRPSGVASVTVAYYMSFEDELYVCVLRGDEVWERRVPVARSLLRSLLSDLDSVYRDQSDTLTKLSRYLLWPVEDLLKGASELLVVPGGFIAKVPFGALPTKETSKPLLSDLATTMVPSVTAHAFLAEHSSEIASGSRSAGTVLAVAPSPAPALGLLPLAAAASEARTIAGLYRDPLVLQGPSATVPAFSKMAGHSTIVHFAGHAVVNPRLPHLSYLALSPDQQNPEGRLSAAAIARLSFPNTQLVVLSACGAAGGHSTYSEGVLSLARAFMSAGVPSVIAPVWPVPDSETAAFQEELHRALSRGLRPADAVRRAQLKLAEDGRPLEAWAPWLVVGVS